MKLSSLFLAALSIGASLFAAESKAPAAKAAAAKQPPEPELAWHDVTTWGVEGRAFAQAERKAWFDRLPAAAEGKVTTAVWNLSRDSAGMVVYFRTDATAIWTNYTVRKEKLAGFNMTAIGASGIDLYAKDPQGHWRWAGVARPEAKTVRQAIVTDLAPGMRDYAAYLPLYNGVEALSLGVPVGAKFEPIAPRTAKPIVFYGTSITHGASAATANNLDIAPLIDRKSTRLNSSHVALSRMPSSA